MRLEPASVRASVRVCVRVLTLSNMNISDTSWSIAIKFYLNHQCGGRKATLGFGLDRIRTHISMATNISLRVIMGKYFTTLSSSFLIGSSSFLQVTRTSTYDRTSSKFGQIGLRTSKLAAFERLEKYP